ncbi:uncharacterized protein SAPINGB_P006438 [Magnusiomyces paraingens]|uniref:RING-type E3 ubiquitin transferase n=1 Tax=Magnusiomyces paraingens TaxID=2606893 RepID=A0A5E8C7N5_9ASCO|nr:uncharacterized protein SAPINGB_P006438 [Saprochaete ingens]VVT58895.1 unnamed protein product [Saprochaete ingens]
MDHQHSSSHQNENDISTAVCRICRGENSESEPLFHPCKCSGSIKYVHQDCLKEWIEKSNKHMVCDLCNTKFKFSKVYKSDMPSKIPLDIITKNALSTLKHTLLSTIPKTLQTIFAIYLWLHVPIIIRQSLTLTLSFAHTLVINPKPRQFKQKPLTQDYARSVTYHWSQFFIDPRKIYHFFSKPSATTTTATTSTPTASTQDLLSPPDSLNFYLQGCALIFFFIVLYLAISMLRWAVQSEIERITENGTTLKNFLGIEEMEQQLLEEEKSKIKMQEAMLENRMNTELSIAAAAIARDHKNHTPLTINKPNSLRSTRNVFNDMFRRYFTDLAGLSTTKIMTSTSLAPLWRPVIYQYYVNRISEYNYMAALIKDPNEKFFPKSRLAALAAEKSNMTPEKLKQYQNLLQSLVDEKLQLRQTILFFRIAEAIIPPEKYKEYFKDYQEIVSNWNFFSDTFSYHDQIQETHLEQTPLDILITDVISYLDNRPTQKTQTVEALHHMQIIVRFKMTIKQMFIGAFTQQLKLNQQQQQQQQPDNTKGWPLFLRPGVLGAYELFQKSLLKSRKMFRENTLNALQELPIDNLIENYLTKDSSTDDGVINTNVDFDFYYKAFKEAVNGTTVYMSPKVKANILTTDPNEMPGFDDVYEQYGHEFRAQEEDFTDQLHNENENENVMNNIPGQFRPGDFVADDDFEADNLDLEDLRDIANFLSITGPLKALLFKFALTVALGFTINFIGIGVPYTFGSCCFVGIGFLVVGTIDLSISLGNKVADMILSRFFHILAGFVETKKDYYLALSARYWLESQNQARLGSFLWRFLYQAYAPYPHSFFYSVTYIFTGLATVIAIGSYIAYGSFRIAQNITNRRTEIAIIENLRIFGLLVKVVIITGIELFFFPMMCGLLISWALLPILPSITIADTMKFALDWPFISPFVFWGLGTLYMFQFAYYVSMCRGIMRPGVLYFVRDPNDPNIHPVGDIMERDIVSQLGKIGISGLIYTALILLCIGGVVWSFRYVLDFSFIPLTMDLSPELISPGIYLNLCIISIAPLLAISQYFKPVAIIRKLWTNIFGKACHALRLSSFILNKQVPIEQGSVHYGSFKAWFKNVKPDYSSPKKPEDLKTIPPDSAYFVPDGCFVRAPASDNAVVQLNNDLNHGQKDGKIKTKLFLVVTKDDERLDGLEDTDNDLKNYNIVYCPPHFRWKTAGFLSVIWLFGSLIVFSVTGLPIIIGQMQLRLLHQATTEQIQKNTLLCGIVGFPFAIMGITVIDQYSNIKAWELQVRARHGHIYRNYKNLAKLVFKYFALGLAYTVLVPSLQIWLIITVLVEPILVFTSYHALITMRFKLDIAFILYAVYLNLLVYALRSNQWVPILSNNIAKVLAPNPADGNLQGGPWSPNAFVPYKTFVSKLLMQFGVINALGWAVGKGAHYAMSSPLVPEVIQHSPVIPTLAQYPFVGIFALFCVVYCIVAVIMLARVLFNKFRDDEYLVGVQIENLNG